MESEWCLAIRLFLMFFSAKLKNYKLQIAVLLFALAGILGLQYYWVSQTIKLQRNETLLTFQQEVEGIGHVLEDNYYCFRLYGETDVPASGTFSVISTSSGLSDTMDLYEHRREGFDSSKFYNEMRFSNPMRVRSEFRFEYIEPDRSKGDSLTKKEKALLGQYDRYIRYDDIPLVDTVYLHDEIDRRNAQFHDEVLIGVELIIPETQTLIYSYVPFETNGLEMLGQISHELYHNFAFLQNVTCRFHLYRKHSVRGNFNLWVGGVSVILALLLIGIVVYFFRSTAQQRRLAEMKDELLANITHEFNTPVTNIALALKSIKATDDRGKRGVSIIQEENNRIKTNIENLLSVSSLGAESTDGDHIPISVHEAIGHALQVFEIQVQERGAEVNTRFLAENDSILGNANHFENMLHCLIDNALKYCDGTPSIEIRTTSNAKRIIVEIEDQGLGLSNEDTALIFEKFYRVSDQYRHDHKGFGLGLFYVKGVVEGMKGTIGVKSKLGSGSTFTISIPLNKPGS